MMRLPSISGFLTIPAPIEEDGSARSKVGVNLKKNNGFSLLELLIVVAIILVIATIAIPSLLRSRQSANESGAVANMRNLNTAEVSYSSTHNLVYGQISDLIAAGLLDDRYGNPNFNGYQFSIS